MGIRTKQQYLDSLRDQHPDVYMLGEKVDNIVDHPLFASSLNHMGQTFSLAHEPEFRDLVRIHSPLIDEEINLWSHIPQDSEPYLRKSKVLRKVSAERVCILRCLEPDALTPLWAVTYDIDKKHGTQYHEHLVEFVKRAQREDLMVSASVMDTKGDRSLRPGEGDADMYVRCVRREKDGIVVRGAKANTSGSPGVNQILVVPGGALKPEEKDYAVAFAIKPDTKGVKFICRPTTRPSQPRQIEKRMSSQFSHVESIVILDDVFVPWSDVFMCGETEFAGQLVSGFACTHRAAKCSCQPGHIDFLIGVAAAMADLNGVPKAPHIKDRITDMIMAAETGYSAAIRAAVDGWHHPSGVYFPNFLAANVGKYQSCSKISDEYAALQDIAGGLSVTAPTEKDWLNPELRPLLERYLQGKQGVPTEERFRMLKMVEDLTCSEFGGWFMGLSINAAGSPQAERVDVLRLYDVERSKKMARKMAEIVEKDDKKKK